jgi:GTPase
MISPESDDGNIEYKLKLLNIDDSRIKTLATQMRYRCQEGDGECIYNLGIRDDGTMEGMTDIEYEETIKNMNTIADKNNYTVKLISKSNVSDNKNIYEVLVREHNENKYTDLKVAVAAQPDSGKTTLVSTLATGVPDDGRGKSRSFVFNYIHELKTGRTSSISHQILGFDYDGKIVNYQSMTNSRLSWSEIVSKSCKIVSFFDLPGHESYLKTTILGLTSSFPDICMIVIDGNNGIKPMTKEHILLCITLNISFIIVVTKIDICENRQNVLKETMDGIKKFLNHPGIKRLPFVIKDNDDISLANKHIYSDSIIPIFMVSNVTGIGLDKLKTFLNIVGKKNPVKNNDFVEFYIDHVWNVYGFGTVIGGHLMNGTISVGDKLFLGPNYGEYEQISIRTIQCKKINLTTVSSGSYVCLGIKRNDKLTNIRRGNVIISSNVEKISVKKFTAKINVLRAHATTIKVGYEPIFHAYAIRQVIKILDIKDKKNARNIIYDDDKCLRNGDYATVSFSFKYAPQYIKAGTRFVLCEGRTKVMGEILNFE